MTLDDLFEEIGMGGSGTPVASTPTPVSPPPITPAAVNMGQPPTLGALMGPQGSNTQKLMQLLPVLLSGIQGKAGVGAFMQGWQQADEQIRQQQNRAQVVQQNQREMDLRQRGLEAQIADRQAVEADRKAREQASLERAFVGELDKATTKDQYDQLVSQYETLMGTKPNVLRAKYPFTAPNIQSRAERVWRMVSTGPGKDGIRPGAVVNFDVDGDGIPEHVPVEKLAELAGQPLMYDPDTNQPIFAPKDAKQPGDKFQELLKANRATFQVEKGRAPNAQEDKQLVTDAINQSSELGRKDTSEADTLRLDLLRAEVDRMKAGGTGPITATGPDALKDVDAGTAGIVKAIAEYRQAPPTMSRQGSPGARIMALVNAYDPTYDAKEYPARSAIVKGFTSGKEAANIRSLNTAIGHLGTLQEKADALGNAGPRIWNAVRTAGLEQVGDSRVTEFKAAANAVAGELSTTFKGTATEGEIASWRSAISQSQSPQQLKNNIRTIVTLINSRLSALEDQYTSGMKKPPSNSFLSDHAEDVLKRIGGAPGGSGGASLRFNPATGKVEPQ